MGKIKDLTGQKFGELTVLKFAYTKGHSYWECLCSCGNKIIVPSNSLKTGNTKSCGCLNHKSSHKSLIGQKFNKLTVLELHHKEKLISKNGKQNGYEYFYLCECECGKKIIVNSHNLTRNRVKSCGCMKKLANIKDITGEKFGRWTVIRISHTKKKCNSSSSEVYWLCQCECGTQKILSGSVLKRGISKSCGCLQKELTKKRATKHGMKNTRLYRIWHGMKGRCLNPKDKAYFLYGGRGVTVFKEWQDDFMNFYNWAIQNNYSDDLTLDRIDCNGNYEPNNCRWTTIKEQQRNRRNNTLITFNGETHCISEWAEILNIKPSTLQRRLGKWSIEKALTLAN